MSDIQSKKVVCLKIVIIFLIAAAIATRHIHSYAFFITFLILLFRVHTIQSKKVICLKITIAFLGIAALYTKCTFIAAIALSTFYYYLFKYRLPSMTK